MRKSTLTLDPLEARRAPVVAIEYLFLIGTPTGIVVSGKPLAQAPASPFAGVKIDPGPAQPIGELVGWPPIKVGR